ncbi:hypothetical protein OGAPHI_006069 [Ogataea philodendri]|uniref:Uncharacterized protein n=1 Tax=Ogataea philodendri TaxID=1378263 RepID=A0A9P8NY38_9ASCO|nr:uncharacterized protein OGAPHI_006069 [Ogataea philodendri]KAH3661890.1 hypothetical protein OGAPHI_006069 [Ogataea philodendri]
MPRKFWAICLIAGLFIICFISGEFIIFIISCGLGIPPPAPPISWLMSGIPPPSPPIILLTFCMMDGLDCICCMARWIFCWLNIPPRPPAIGLAPPCCMFFVVCAILANIFCCIKTASTSVTEVPDPRATRTIRLGWSTKISPSLSSSCLVMESITYTILLNRLLVSSSPTWFIISPIPPGNI